MKICKKKKVSFQGIHGAYSDMVCRKHYKDHITLPCKTFEDTMNSVENDKAEIAMIPVENSIAGRVTDMHLILQQTKLKIIAEYYHKIEHNLLSKKNAKIQDLSLIYSHEQALAQCKDNIKKINKTPIKYDDTAGAALFISKSQSKSNGAIASDLAAKIYKLKILRKNFQDKKNNITRFLVFSKKQKKVSSSKKVRTTIVFETKNLPASLYKALGGFANNGINLSRLESFFVNEEFRQSSFLLDIESHPNDNSFRKALTELKKYSISIKILGYYEAARLKANN